jgi:two-component system, OmpR family, sensor kinase
MAAAQASGKADQEIAALCELMAAVTHDLRTPLTPIKGYAEILRARPGLDRDRIEQYAGTIVLAAARMEHDIELLSSLAALYTGRAELQRDRVDVAPLIGERTEMWRGRVPGRQFSAATDDAVVISDVRWLGRVVDELVENAVRTLPETEAVTISALRSDDGAHVRVSATADSGGADADGLPAGRLAMAFVGAVADVCGFTVSEQPLAVVVPSG